MIEHPIARKSLVCTGILTLFVTTASSGNAFNMFDESNDCITNNCRSITINGTVLTDIVDPPSVLPWVGQAFATTGDCVRFHVVRQETDLEMTIVSPNGQVWIDDDSGGRTRPLIKIENAPVDGWYTIQISHFFGSPNQSDFTLRYGRYFGAGASNCNNPTSPLFRSQMVATEKDEDGASGRPFVAGSPGQ